jgi:hypothetical protein
MAAEDVVNQALIRLGEKPITVINDDTRSGEAASDIYVAVYKEVQKNFAWNCLMKRGTPAESSPSSLYDFTYQYDLSNMTPAAEDVLRVLEINNEEGYRWRVEGQNLFTDQQITSMRYIDYEDDEANWDPLLLEAVVARLAQRLAPRITGNLSREQIAGQDYLMALVSAAQVRAIEGQEDFNEIIRYLQGSLQMQLARSQNHTQGG